MHRRSAAKKKREQEEYSYTFTAGAWQGTGWEEVGEEYGDVKEDRDRDSMGPSVPQPKQKEKQKEKEKDEEEATKLRVLIADSFAALDRPPLDLSPGMLGKRLEEEKICSHSDLAEALRDRLTADLLRVPELLRRELQRRLAELNNDKRRLSRTIAVDEEEAEEVDDAAAFRPREDYIESDV